MDPRRLQVALRELQPSDCQKFEQFRRARSLAVLKAAGDTYGWDRRPSPKNVGTGNILTGRGRLLVSRQDHRRANRRS